MLYTPYLDQNIISHMEGLEPKKNEQWKKEKEGGGQWQKE